jgi:hypothetical protein|nr:MAG TPA: hypothetical protein [Caudoviricetes sp.]
MTRYTVETCEGRQARYDEAVRIYKYNRQWLSHNDSVSASQHRTAVTKRILKRECIRAGVWDD